jgi:hypothetical protein
VARVDGKKVVAEDRDKLYRKIADHLKKE